MKTQEIHDLITTQHKLGNDVDYVLLCKLLIRKGSVPLLEEEDFIDLLTSQNVAKSRLYTMVRKRVSTLVRQGKIDKEKDGKQIILSPSTNKHIPEWDLILEHMVGEYPEWFNNRDGGTNTGGGYKWILQKFYTELEDFLN